jgi:hypothetical protein
MAKATPKIEITKHPEFRVVYVSGVFGAVKGDEGFMKFYLDIVEPKVKTGDKPSEMEIDKITRELQIEVRMTSMQFVSIADWMARHIKNLEEQGILRKEEKPSKETEAYRV